MYGAVHIFVCRGSIVEIQIVSINKVLQSKVEQTWEGKIYRTLVVSNVTRMGLQEESERERDKRTLRDLPKGVTRGHVMQYTTMTEKITSIQAYC